MNSTDKAVSYVSIAFFVTIAIIAGLIANYERTVATEAIKAGLHQDRNGRWVESEKNKERGDDAR